ncbi:bifunctional diguanylate cyclase/phosphodiesterase [Massilia sp. H6]|uniref:putative bifunctional diguanylate cyclase/phosphodiesterase n=1 Tax=Massilia sp. H6 TaxID=2970464 RepID=UPI002168E186|nr:EAL domain-containing protein [Massilia sp. H6]UVW30066.1 EAL domain-containing protein [Massilia sp. H6]
MINRIVRWADRQTLSTRLKWVSLATIASVTLAYTLLLIAIQVGFLTSSLLAQSQAQASVVSENLAAALVFEDHDGAAAILTALRVVPEVESATAYDMKQAAFAHFARTPGAPEAFLATPERPDYLLDWQAIRVFQPVWVEQQRVGTVVLRSSLASVYAKLGLNLALTVPLMLLAMAAAWAILSRLQIFVTAPINALSKVSQEISLRGDYSLRTRVSPSPDIGALATAFNGMLDRIEQRERDLEAEIGERKRIEARLDRLAHFDPVTKLHNRHFFNERLQTAISTAQQTRHSAVLMFVDLDNFKAVNDTLGHDIGDELLCLVARRLAIELRSDDVISRIGGDEFAILLENASDPEVGPRIAKKCLAALGEPISINGNEIHIGASIGMSMFPDHGTDIHALLKYADMAMYQAKTSGKNAYRIFTPSMQDEAKKRFTIDNNLRRALERDEFLLLYQPQIDPCSGEIVSVEALIRWHHPEAGMINPLDFIPIAEETGIIVPIGEWVLRQACHDLKCWQAQGYELGIAVNLSGRQLRDESFVGSVLAVLQETGIGPQSVELELTESMLMDAAPVIMERLHALRAQGIALAIDDFGTGYSSMSYLKNLPVGTLKIDRSFVSGLPDHAEDAAIVRAIIALAGSLQMEVVAEGIETLEQGQFLQTLGCKKFQGYFYGKPQSASQIGQLLAQRTRPSSAGLVQA